MASWVLLFRIFLPSWHFFVHAGHGPRVKVRSNDLWLNVPVHRELKPWSLFFNPLGNAELRFQSLLDALTDEIAAGQDLNSSMTLSLIRQQLRARGISGDRFQVVDRSGDPLLEATL